MAAFRDESLFRGFFEQGFRAGFAVAHTDNQFIAM